MTVLLPLFPLLVRFLPVRPCPDPFPLVRRSSLALPLWVQPAPVSLALMSPALAR